MAVLVGITVAGLAVLPFLDFSLRPALEEREILVAVQAPPGTSLNRMTAVAGEAVEDLGPSRASRTRAPRSAVP